VERADRYADAVQSANEELIGFAESCSEEQWATLVPGENWSVGALVHHCALGNEVATSWLREMVERGGVPTTSEELDAMNARHAIEFAEVGIAETVALLRSNGAAAIAYIRTLSDEDLDREAVFAPGGGTTVTVERFASVLGRHGLTHLGHARQALGGT